MAVSEDEDGDVQIGASVARFRAARGLSQAELAEQLGVAQQTIAKIEKGSRPLKYSEAEKIARILRISTGAFGARPESVIAQANAIELQHDMNRAIENMSTVATDLANIFVMTAMEIAIDRARPEEYRAPHLQQLFLNSALRRFDALPAKFSSSLTAAVRAAAEKFAVRLPKTATAQQILKEVAETPVEFNRPALEGMDGLSGWLERGDDGSEA